ncbi:MAG: Lrp/AsnC family transcriptional regulator [Rhizobiaceae bacterium]|nr:Lrp/AsnC family transcriptional regulator [Rhizobiaceae bacterium]
MLDIHPKNSNKDETSSVKLDDLDLKILRLLQQDSDIAISDLGEHVGLSHTPCWRRIKKMQEAGIILGNRSLLDAEKVRLDVSIFVFVKLDTHSADVLDAFENATATVPEILQCYTMSGEFDYLLRVVVSSVREYEKTVKGKLLKLPHVGTMNSHFALNEVKNTTELPL